MDGEDSMRGRRATVVLGLAIILSACSVRLADVGQAGGETGTSPTPAASPDASPATASASPSAGVEPSVQPTPAPSPTPGPTPAPTSRTTPTQTPIPSVELELEDIPSGNWIHVRPGGTVDTPVLLRTVGLEQERCDLVHATTPDSRTIAPSTETLPPVGRQTVTLIDGRHTLRVSCPSAAGALTAEVWLVAGDGVAERCAGWTFAHETVSVSTLEKLTDGMVGSWHGCVVTPWVPIYSVDLAFRADGTYSSTGELLDFHLIPGMYYGTDNDDPGKRWRIDDFQASGLGSGFIDIAFGAASGGSVNHDPVSAIRLMGDQLEFEMLHHGSYGPLVFQLVRD
jgi:hypothetical protein